MLRMIVAMVMIDGKRVRLWKIFSSCFHSYRRKTPGKSTSRGEGAIRRYRVPRRDSRRRPGDYRFHNHPRCRTTVGVSRRFVMAPRDVLDGSAQSAPVTRLLSGAFNTDPVTIGLMVTLDVGLWIRKLKKLNGSPGRTQSEVPVGPSQ